MVDSDGLNKLRLNRKHIEEVSYHINLPKVTTKY